MATTATASQASSRRCGSREPSLRVVDEYEETLGADAASIAEYVGIDLLGWQRDVANDFLAVDAEGKWAHGRNCLSVPRQNGKSYLVIAICLYLMLVKNCKVAYTAQNYATVLDIFDRFKRIFGTKANDQFAAYPELNEMVLRVRGTASREGIELKRVKGKDGKEYDPCISFSTRTESSLRGQSYDVLVIDEAQCCTSGQFSSIGPVTKSGPAGNSMHVFIGTPETPTGRGEIFGNVRKDALSESHERTCWVEWGVDSVGDVLDSERWYATNPSLGILGDETEMRSAAGTMNAFDFAQEYMGMWARQSVNAAIGSEQWDACATSTPCDGKVAYAVKFHDGRGAIAVCVNSDTPHVEIVDDRDMSRGMTWFADWLDERSDEALAIVVDGMENAQPLIDELQRRGIRKNVVVKPRSSDVAAACSNLLNRINERTVTHFAQPSVDAAAKSCSRRAIGSGGGFGFAGDGAHLIEALALALWGAGKSKRDPDKKPRFNL